MSNDGRQEIRKTVNRRPYHEEHDKDHDDMWGAAGTHDCFEVEFVNRIHVWSILFQTARDDAEHSRG